MKRFLFGLALIGFLVVPACTAEERKDALQDAATYSGAPSAAAPDVAKEVGKDILTSGDPASILMYVGGLIGTVAIGWIGRKYIQKKYAK